MLIFCFFSCRFDDGCVLEFSAKQSFVSRVCRMFDESDVGLSLGDNLGFGSTNDNSSAVGGSQQHISGVMPLVADADEG